MMTSEQYWARRTEGSIYDQARLATDPDAKKPWVVLAYKRTSGYYKVSIVAGYNRWTGEVIGWSLRDFSDDRYDLSNAVEVA